MDESSTSQSIHNKTSLQTERWYHACTQETLVSKWLAIVLLLVLPFLGFWVGLQYGTNLLPYTDQGPELILQKNIITEVTSTTGTLPHIQKYVDADGRFSLEYPPHLVPVVEKEKTYQIDNVSFNNATSTVVTVAIYSYNSRWPNLQAYLSDQVMMTKSDDTLAIPKIWTRSGLSMYDAGSEPVLGRRFVGHLNSDEYIIIYFKDEVLIREMLSSFSLSVAEEVADLESQIP